MEQIVSTQADRTRIRGLLEPFIQDLHDWRVEVQRLFERTRASQEGHVIDLAIVNEIEIAREALDWEIEAFTAVAKDLGDNAPSEVDLEQLGQGLRDLQLATELLADVVDDMRPDETGPVIENAAMIDGER